MSREPDSRDYPYLSTMDEVLDMVAEFVDRARHADTPVLIDAYLKMASRSLRCALEIHGDHMTAGGRTDLAGFRLEEGEKVK
jgi:hypothetical protein